MSTIKLEITEGQINNAIAVALSEAFTDERKDALLRDVIRAHITYKHNSYDKETILSKAVNDIIKTQIDAAMRTELEKLRPEVDKMVAETLGPNFKADCLGQIQNALKSISLERVRFTAQVVDY